MQEPSDASAHRTVVVELSLRILHDIAPVLYGPHAGEKETRPTQPLSADDQRTPPDGTGIGVLHPQTARGQAFGEFDILGQDDQLLRLVSHRLDHVCGNLGVVVVEIGEVPRDGKIDHGIPDSFERKVPEGIERQQEEEAVWQDSETSGGRDRGSMSAARCGTAGRTPDARPRAHVSTSSAEIQRSVRDRVPEGQECSEDPSNDSGQEANNGSALLGTRVLREHGGVG